MGLGFSAVLVTRGQKARDRLNERLTAVVSPRTRRPKVEISAFTPAPAKRNASLRGILTAVFGFDPAKQAVYPLNGWLVLLIAFGVAKLTQIVVGFLVGDTLAWAVVPVAWVFFSRSYFGWAEGRHKAALLHQFPDALAMVVRSVRVGIPVQEALRAVAREAPAPTAPEFAKLIDQLSIGATLEDAILEMAARAGIPEYNFFATALALQNQTGGTLSETLEGLADVIRKRVALKARGKALTAEARSSTMILAVLPFGTALMLYLVNPSYIMMLFIDPTGHKLLGAAIVSLSVGLGLIRFLIQRALR